MLVKTFFQVKEYLAQMLAKTQSVQISPELEAKNSLLKNNHTLYQLYKDLVTTGFISADEFWTKQAVALGNQGSDSTQQQEGGLPSAFLVCFRGAGGIIN